MDRRAWWAVLHPAGHFIWCTQHISINELLGESFLLRKMLFLSVSMTFPGFFLFYRHFLLCLLCVSWGSVWAAAGLYSLFSDHFQPHHCMYWLKNDASQIYTSGLGFSQSLRHIYLLTIPLGFKCNNWTRTAIIMRKKIMYQYVSCPLCLAWCLAQGSLPGNLYWLTESPLSWWSARHL